MVQRQQSSKLPSDNHATLIGPEIQVVGRIEGQEELKVQGYVEGSIDLTEALVVDNGGVVVGEVRALEVIVQGIVVGNIVADRRIVLQATARVVGDLKAPRVTVAGGAAFRGQVAMGETGDDGQHETSGGHRSGHGSGHSGSRWRSGGASRAARSASSGGGVSRARVNRSPAAKPTGVLSRRVEVEEPAPRQPPLRKRIEREIEREVAPPAQIEIEEAEGEAIDLEEGMITTSGGKKQAARPRVPARGKHSVDHA